MKSAVAGFSCLSVLCLSVLIVLLCWSQTVLGGSRGSTPNVRAIVLGRCWDFQRSKFGNDAKKWKKNCTAISEAFYRAFAFKSPCELTFADYKPYFDAVGMAENIDKVLMISSLPLSLLWLQNRDASSLAFPLPTPLIPQNMRIYTKKRIPSRRIWAII